MFKKTLVGLAAGTALALGFGAGAANAGSFNLHVTPFYQPYSAYGHSYQRNYYQGDYGPRCHYRYKRRRYRKCWWSNGYRRCAWRRGRRYRVKVCH